MDINRLLVNSQVAPRLYALVYSMWTPEEWRFVAISILVSLGSMAFAFAGIDLKDGLNGIPGLLKHWLNPATLKKKTGFEWLGLSGLGFYLGCLMMSSNHEAILSKEVSPSVPETFGWNYLLQIEIPFQRFLGLIILSGFNSSRDFLPSVLFSTLVSGIFSDPQ